MLTRRNLRIKAFQTLFAGRSRGETKVEQFVSDYQQSIRQFEYMYAFLLQLPSAFNTYLFSEKDIELAKYFPKSEKIRETSVFETHSFVKFCEGSTFLHQMQKNSPYTWNEYGELFLSIFKALKTVDFYKDYLVFEEPTPEQEKEFVLAFYGYLFEESEVFQNEISDVYPDWDNDVFVFYKMLSDSIKDSFKENKLVIIPTYKNREEDYPFVETLLIKTTVESVSYQDLLKRVAKSWDTERIAKIDMVLMEMALTEFLFFPLIPLKVTINEYLDIAKSFSTAKSHIFINGILDRVKEIMMSENKIVKEGRGLRDH
jgi:N utilization substance protein B